MSTPQFKLLDFRYVNRDKYEYLDLEKTSAGNMVSTCMYRVDNTTKYPHYFETPRLRTATDVYKVGNRFILDLVVPIGSAFYEFLIAEDEKNISVTLENSTEWFGDQVPLEIAQEKYKSSLIFRSGGEDPIFRLNVPSYRGKPSLEVYDANKRQIDIGRILPDMEIVCICNKTGLRFQRDTFSGEYDCYKLKILQQSAELPKIPKGYMFNDLNGGSEDEDEDITSRPAPDVDSGSDSELGDLEELDLSEQEDEETVSDGEDTTSGSEDGDSANEDLESATQREYDAAEADIAASEIGGLDEVIIDDGQEISDQSEDEESLNLESDEEDELANELGLEEVEFVVDPESDGEDGHLEGESDDDELGLERLDLTPSKRDSTKHRNALDISELTDDELEL